MSLIVRKRCSGFPTKSNTQRAVQPQKIARGLNRVELNYPCSENKGAYQVHSFCSADLLLCFHICKSPIFSHTQLICVPYEVGPFENQFEGTDQTAFVIILFNVRT